MCVDSAATTTRWFQTACEQLLAGRPPLSICQHRHVQRQATVAKRSTFNKKKFYRFNTNKGLFNFLVDKLTWMSTKKTLQQLINSEDWEIIICIFFSFLAFVFFSHALPTFCYLQSYYIFIFSCPLLDFVIFTFTTPRLCYLPFTPPRFCYLHSPNFFKLLSSFIPS